MEKLHASKITDESSDKSSDEDREYSYKELRIKFREFEEELKKSKR
jgi:hypothetical protein